ncbi:uncharacterized protein LOC123929585 isoform X1 [Meles meles]|uniref:uncharacterized protein LOC123929585 isoform X1 n=1 Tax=Meles meles TaxID=9662 RepID=UPI001E69EEF4|nr:uncharacterized protein LOC123929585 isoform X1 [Meles meles]
MRLTVRILSLDPTLPEVRAGAASPTFGSLRDELRERAPRGGRVAPWSGPGRSLVMLHRPPPRPGEQPGAPELEDLSAPRTLRKRLCCRAPAPGRDPQPEGLSWQESTQSSHPGWLGTRGCRPPRTRAPRSRARRMRLGVGPGWGAREGSLCVSGGFKEALSAATAMRPKTRVWGICH